VPPASWRIVSRSSGRPKITSVETTKLGSRSEWIWDPATVDTGFAGAGVLLREQLAVGAAVGGETLGELTGGAARSIGLGRRGVVDDLPSGEVIGHERGGRLRHRGGQRVVPGRDDACTACSCERAEFGEVVSVESGGADHDGDASLEGRSRVGADSGVGGVVDEDVDVGERVGDGAVDRSSPSRRRRRRGLVRLASSSHSSEERSGERRRFRPVLRLGSTRRAR
jgi:hypothetical protein